MGWIVAGRPCDGRFLRQTAILVAAGVAPDLDLLIGRHSAETHSIGAAMIAATVAAWMRWPVAQTRLRIWLAVFSAWLSHPIMDALGSDTSVPVGVMLYWPFSTVHVQSMWEIFDPISRRWQQAGFIEFNLRAVAREVLLVGPLTALVWIVRRRWAGMRIARPDRRT